MSLWGTIKMESHIKKIYMAVNESGFKNNDTLQMFQTAVYSCLKNTNLELSILYTGEINKNIQEVIDVGVNVIFRDPSLKPHLVEAYGENYHKFCAHWLRFDIPLIEEAEYVLYTDIDVVFMEGFEAPTVQPTYLAAAPEHDRENFSYFNSGVMILNIPSMRNIASEFSEAVIQRLNNNFQYPPHDQKSFNDFFKNKWDKLPNEYNWKPYWGKADDIQILHFHGPKPPLVRRVFKKDPTLDKVWEKIVSRNTEGYEYYCDFWDGILKESQSYLKSRN